MIITLHIIYRPYVLCPSPIRVSPFRPFRADSLNVRLFQHLYPMSDIFHPIKCSTYPEAMGSMNRVNDFRHDIALFFRFSDYVHGKMGGVLVCETGNVRRAGVLEAPFDLVLNT